MSNRKYWLPAISDVLRHAQGVEPWSEESLVEELVSFGNGPEYAPRVDLGHAVEAVMPWFHDLDRPETEPTEEELEEFAAYERKLRHQVVKDLDTIAAGGDLTKIAKRALRDAARVVLIPDFDDSGSVTYRLLGEDLAARIGFITLLLLDTTRGYGDRVCRCNLESCGLFFWERRDPSGGSPGRKYCSEDHMKAADRAGAKERVRRYRARQKAAKKGGRR